MSRMFSAIEIPVEIGGVLSALKKDFPGVPWVSDVDMHLTIKFFGETDDSIAVRLFDELSKSSQQAFQVELATLGTFSTESQTILWAGIAEWEDLEQLYHQHETVSRALGLAIDQFEFHPHVTLAYLTNQSAEAVVEMTAEYAGVSFGKLQVPRFAVYSTNRSPAARRYALERTFDLRKNRES